VRFEGSLLFGIGEIGMSNNARHKTDEASSLFCCILPGLRLLAGYRREWLRGDLVAGVLLAAFLVPAGIADASLANLSPDAGLYACLFSGLVFWLFCGSHQTAITTTTAISLLVGSSLGELANGDSSRFGALAACTAILVSALALVTWIVRAGVIINFVSETVLLGFKCGIALVLASTQLPKLFGVPGSHGSFMHSISHFASHIHETNTASLALGLGALTLLLLGKVFFKRAPIALIVVIAGIAIGSTMNLADRGVKVMGAVPHGLPGIALPKIGLTEVNNVLPLAMACFLLGAIETSAVGRTFALKYGGGYNPNQEFLALGAANLASGLGRGFPVSGGMSQSLVNEEGGARTPLSGLVAALVMLVVVVFASGLLSKLPQTVLAAIVLAAVVGLVHVDALKQLWRFSRTEFAVSVVAMVGVLESGTLRGVLIGALLSLVLLLRRGSRPHTTELGRVPGTNYFADWYRHPENEREAGVFVFRVESPLLYFNVEYVRDRFFELMGRRGAIVRLAVLSLGTVSLIDLAGALMMSELHRSLRDRGIALRLSEAHGQIRESLRRAGFEAECGPVEANMTVSAVIAQWKSGEQVTSRE
jgi:high affinity sulfate transporter 1